MDDQFKPRWRHFSVNSTVWVQNPFDEEVRWQVADDHNNPVWYKVDARKVAELPGGPIATLGVKRIVDEMVQNEKYNEDGDAMRIWEPEVREKYETKIIIRIKEDPRLKVESTADEVDLTTSDPSTEKDVVETAKPVEESFPGVKTNAAGRLVDEKGKWVSKASAATAGLPETQLIEEK